MAKDRCRKGEIYWYLSYEHDPAQTRVEKPGGKWVALSAHERYDKFDDGNYESGNYYLDSEKAREEVIERNNLIREKLGMQRLRRRAAKQRAASPRHIESEKDVERHLVKEAAARGWLPLKYSSGITTGYPDRCILLPGGRTVWVEVKTTGEKPRPLQKVRLRHLSNMGFITAVIDTREKADHLIAELQKLIIRKDDLFTT